MFRGPDCAESDAARPLDSKLSTAFFTAADQFGFIETRLVGEQVLSGAKSLMDVFSEIFEVSHIVD